MSWYCANMECGRVHDRDTLEPEVCEVCEARAEAAWYRETYLAQLLPGTPPEPFPWEQRTQEEE